MSVEVSEEERGGPDSGDPHDAPPLYADRCKRHGNVAVPGNCGDCADTRKANQARPLTLVRDTKRCIVHDENYTTVCRGCRADEIAVDDDAARRRGA